MDLTLRPLAADDAPALQALYDQAPAAFTRLLGRPAPAGQAARDIAQARATPGRYQFGAVLNGELVGLIDCKLADDDPGQAHIGMLLLADYYDDQALFALMLRITSRWLNASFGVQRLTTSVPAHEPGALALWQSQGFALTGEQFRRAFDQFRPRFLVLARDQAATKEGREASR